jgi:hypothetical protein
LHVSVRVVSGTPNVDVPTCCVWIYAYSCAVWWEGVVGVAYSFREEG